jgi:hypothetical protein
MKNPKNAKLSHEEGGKEMEWAEEKAWLDKVCDRGPCTGQSCGWIGCAKLADRLCNEVQTARRKKWRESKRQQRERKRHIGELNGTGEGRA